MADVRVTEPHSFSAAEAKAKIGAFEEMLAKYRVKVDWAGNSAKLKGIGVSGDINVTDRDCTVLVSLGRMAKMAGIDPVKLEGSIRKRLKAAFSPE
ncbi:MAG: polyhydroxyalkanoic acid system family protein [Myxococcales bacterium]|nr:polyhydroxyalkanoic acid system family protein [Myxococcales bacterium]MCB9523514.1 polyhydroxyalkanoic acid system family protein [Myxococcales bacterium]